MIDERTTTPQSTGFKARLLKCLLSAIALGILHTYIAGYGPDYIDFWVSTLPRIIGYVFGLFLISAIFAGIGFMFQRRPRRPFVSTFVPCFWVVSILAFLSTIALLVTGDR